MQTSDSFELGALLSFSGGVQDAYTYYVRDKVFANVQTGNIVLMSQNLMEGNFTPALHYMCSILSFALGVFVAERIENRFKIVERIHWRQIIILIEMISLIMVGFLPTTMNMAANMIVSFSCATQLQTFRKVQGYAYVSTMCTGNLRSATESFSKFLRDKNMEHLYKMLRFLGIILMFAVGAGVCGVVSDVLGIRTIWLSVAVLFVVMGIMSKKEDI